MYNTEITLNIEGAQHIIRHIADHFKKNEYVFDFEYVDPKSIHFHTVWRNLLTDVCHISAVCGVKINYMFSDPTECKFITAVYDTGMQTSYNCVCN